MVEVWLPYGGTEVYVRVREENLLKIIKPTRKEAVSDAKAEVQASLEKPIGAKKLRELVGPDDRVAVAVGNANIFQATDVAAARVLEELREAGVKDDYLNVILTSDLGVPAGKSGQPKLGENTGRDLKSVVSHDLMSQDLVHVGDTSFGTKVYLNRLFMEASFRVLVGNIELHYYGGYTGGSKIVLPGLSGFMSVRSNCMLMLKPNSAAGVFDGNPVRMDMEEACRLAKVGFAVNLVLNEGGKLVRAFSGDVTQAYLEGVKLVDEMFKIPLERAADVVVASAGGSPYDMYLQQSYRAVENVVGAVKRNGVVVLVAECSGGYGADAFHDWMFRFRDLRELGTQLKRSYRVGGETAYLLGKALDKARIYLISTIPSHYATRVFRMRTARTVNSALQLALRIAGKDARVLVVPHASLALPVLKNV